MTSVLCTCLGLSLLLSQMQGSRLANYSSNYITPHAKQGQKYVLHDRDLGGWQLELPTFFPSHIFSSLSKNR